MSLRYPGSLDEIRKYRPEEIDYAQLDPYLSEVEMRLGLVKPVQGLRVIAEDGRAYLKRTDKKYDAILVNYPEPKTFQTNRYFTEEFMRLAKAHLNQGGVLSFSVEGYESYLSATARSQASSLYNTASAVFSHVLILPGQRIYFITSDSPLSKDIPGLLAGKGIKTDYIGYYFSGDVSQDRMSSLMKLLDPHAPRNTDLKPYIMRVAHEGWFAKYSSYPLVFFIALACFFTMYLTRLRQEEFVLFTTGFVNMGSEIITIFSFQILLGFLYMKISLIITVFLAGLIPGILFGRRYKGSIRQSLIISDGLLVLLLIMFLGLLITFSQGLNGLFFYSFAFLISGLCGFQFPLVAGAHGGRQHRCCPGIFRGPCGGGPGHYPAERPDHPCLRNYCCLHGLDRNQACEYYYPNKPWQRSLGGAFLRSSMALCIAGTTLNCWPGFVRCAFANPLADIKGSIFKGDAPSGSGDIRKRGCSTRKVMETRWPAWSAPTTASSR